MTGLVIYTADYDPKRLYADPEAGDRDRALVERVVRFDDGPLGLLVEFRDSGGRIVWTFQAKRGGPTSRTAYFIADFATEDPALFDAFARALRSLPEEWILPYADDLRWDLGVELQDLPAGTPGLTASDRDQLFGRLDREGGAGTGPLVFGVREYRDALEVVRAIQQAGIECRVAVGSDGDPDVIPDLDFLLLPGARRNFEPQSLGVETVIGAAANPAPAAAEQTGDTDVSAPDTDTDGVTSEADGTPTQDSDRNATLDWRARLAAGVLLVVLGFSAYSFVSKDPVHPITGLSAIGGVLGTLAGIPVLDRHLGGPDSPENGGSRLLAPIKRAPGTVLLLLAYGTAWAFVFPTLVRVGGRFVTPDQWVFGAISRFTPALLSVGLFVTALFALTTLALVGHRRHRGAAAMDTDLLLSLVRAHLRYGLAILVLTGFAASLWFPLIPSA
jgi:hypothetical protein